MSKKKNKRKYKGCVNTYVLVRSKGSDNFDIWRKDNKYVYLHRMYVNGKLQLPYVNKSMNVAGFKTSYGSWDHIIMEEFETKEKLVDSIFLEMI